MADMYHEIQINASPTKVYEAITTQKGLRGWWTGDSVAEPKVGSVAEFGFSKRATLFRMCIAELIPEKRVIWECLGDFDEWIGTKLIWEIMADDDATKLRFTHGNWRSTDSWFATCNTTWGALMYRLKDYVMGKKTGPLFKG